MRGRLQVYLSLRTDICGDDSIRVKAGIVFWYDMKI